MNGLVGHLHHKQGSVSIHEVFKQARNLSQQQQQQLPRILSSPDTHSSCKFKEMLPWSQVKHEAPN